METEKKVYEEPTVKMVEFDFSDRIAASGCTVMDGWSSECDHGITSACSGNFF